MNFLLQQKSVIIKTFYFYFYFNMTIKEISKKLNINESTIKSYIYRTLEKYRKIRGVNTMHKNKEKIKLILSDYVDIDNNYEKIKRRISIYDKKRLFVGRLSVLIPVILLLIFICFGLASNRDSGLVDKKNRFDEKKDTIVINDVANADDSSMYYNNYMSTDFNLIDNFWVFKEINDSELFEIVFQNLLYNEESEKIYFGGFRYLIDDSKFLYLYVSNNNIHIYEQLFVNCRKSLIDSNTVYIVNSDGIIFVKFVTKDKAYVIQTNINDTSVYVNFVRRIIKY